MEAMWISVTCHPATPVSPTFGEGQAMTFMGEVLNPTGRTQSRETMRLEFRTTVPCPADCIVQSV